MTDLQRIMDVVTEVTGFTRENLICKVRKAEKDIVRGVFYVVANSEGHRPRAIGKYIHRSRVNVQIVLTHYKGYIQTGDARTVRIYNQIKERL